MTVLIKIIDDNLLTDERSHSFLTANTRYEDLFLQSLPNPKYTKDCAGIRLTKHIFMGPVAKDLCFYHPQHCSAFQSVCCKPLLGASQNS